MGWNHQPVNYMYLHLPWKSTIHVGKYTMHGSCTYLNLPRAWNLDPIKIKLRAEIWQANGGSKVNLNYQTRNITPGIGVLWFYVGWVIFFCSKPILLDTPWAHCHHTCSQYWYIVSPTRIWRIFVSGEKKQSSLVLEVSPAKAIFSQEASNELGSYTRCLFFCLGVIPREHHEFLHFAPTISGT